MYFNTCLQTIRKLWAFVKNPEIDNGRGEITGGCRRIFYIRLHF